MSKSLIKRLRAQGCTESQIASVLRAHDENGDDDDAPPPAFTVRQLRAALDELPVEFADRIVMTLGDGMYVDVRRIDTTADPEGGEPVVVLA